MATEVAIPESLSVTNIESEDHDKKYTLLDNIVGDSSLVELTKVDTGLEKLLGAFESPANADKIKEAAVGSKTVNNVFTGDVQTLQGESFLESPSVAKVAFEEPFSISEHDNKEKPVSADEKQLQNDHGIEIEKIEEKGRDSLSNANIIETCLPQAKAEEPDLKVVDESSKEESTIDQPVQIDKNQQASADENQQTSAHENQRSIEEEVKKTLSQHKEPYADSADDCLDKEVHTVTDVFDEVEGVDKNLSAKNNLIEDELEIKNVKEEDKELKTVYDTTVTEKGYEASGESENEGQEKKDTGKIHGDVFTDDAISELKSTTLATGDGANDTVDTPPLTLIEDKTEDKNELDTRMVTPTEKECSAKVDSPMIFDGSDEKESGSDKIPQEKHQAEIFENISPTYVEGKDDEIDDQKENIPSQIQVPDMTEDLGEEKIIEPKATFRPEEENSESDKGQEQTILQHDKLKEETPEPKVNEEPLDETDDQKENIPSQIQVPAMTEDSGEEKIIEPKATFRPEENIKNVEIFDDEGHLEKENSESDKGQEQTILQHDKLKEETPVLKVNEEPLEKEKPEHGDSPEHSILLHYEPKEEELESNLNVTSETKESVCSSESAERITDIQDKISTESLKQKGIEENQIDTVEMSEHCVPKEKNLPAVDFNESEREVEIPKADETYLPVTDSSIDEKKQVYSEVLDTQEVNETSIASAEKTVLEKTSTEGEVQGEISITSDIETDQSERHGGVDNDRKPEVEDANLGIEEERQKHEESFDKETHEVATERTDTDTGSIAEDNIVTVSRSPAAEEPSDQNSSGIKSKHYSYGAEDDVKSNINKDEEVHDGPGIPATEDAPGLIENIEYNSLESIEQAGMRSHDDGQAEESTQEEDNKDHIIEEGNRVDKLEDSVAEIQDFHHRQKEAKLSEEEIVEESATAQASEDLSPDTNPDDESRERNYDTASSPQQEDREQRENKEPSITSVVPNVEENLEKEKKEAKSDENNANESGIAKEEEREPLPVTFEQNELTDGTDFDLVSKESGTEIEKTERGYKLEPYEATDGNDSKEIVDEVSVNPKIAGLDEDSEKHITLEESNISDISPELTVAETSNNYKEDLEEQHNIEVSQMIQSVAKGVEDKEKQTIEEVPVNRDSIKESERAAITEEETEEHIKEECDSSTKQSPESTEEIIPEEIYNEDKVSEQLTHDLSSTDNEKHEIDEHVTPILPSSPNVEEVVNESCIQSDTTEIESKEKVEDTSLELKEKADETVFIEDTQEIIKDRIETTKKFDYLEAQNPLDAETVSIESNKDVLEKDRPTINDFESSLFPVVATALERSNESEPKGNNQVEDFDLAPEEKGLTTSEMDHSGNREINMEPKENFSLGVDREIEFHPDVKEAGEKVEYKMPDTKSGDETEAGEQHNVHDGPGIQASDDAPEHVDNIEPSIISVPNVEEDLEKEKKEAKSDENNANENGISKEEEREPLQGTSEKNEITDSTDFDLVCKESGTEIEKTERGYKFEPEEATDGNDSKEIVDEVLENSKIANLDEDSEKPIKLEESNISDTSPEFIGAETLNNYKEDLEDQHNIEVSQMIQSVAKGTEDNEKQAIEEEPINRDNIKESETAAIIEEGIGEHIKEECDSSTKQHLESDKEIILEERYNKDEVSGQVTTDLSSTDNEKHEIDEHVTPSLPSLPVVEEVVNESCTQPDTTEIESKEKVEDSILELKEKTDETVFNEDTQEIIKDRVEPTKNFDDLNAQNPLVAETVSIECNKDVLEKDMPTINDDKSSSFPVVVTVLECSKESEPIGNNQIGGFDLASEEKGSGTTEMEGVVSGNREINVEPKENFNLGVDREIEFHPDVKEDVEKVEYKMPDIESGDDTEAADQLNVHDGPGIPASKDALERIDNIEYNSLESIEQAGMSSHDDGKAEENTKEEDNKDHIIEEDNHADQLEDSVAEFQEFQHQEKEAELSKKEIVEEYTTAQASKELLPDTNPDDESQERNYDATSSLQQDDREQGENKDPPIISVVPNVKEDLEKEKKEEKSDENNAHEHGISKEEEREPLPGTSEQNEITYSTNFDLVSKESGTEIEKTDRGYKLEPDETADSNDSNEIIDEVLVNPKIADLDEESEKHITLEESNISDTSPEFTGAETSNNYKEDLEEQHNIEVIQIVAKGTEDNEKQTIEEEPINRDNIKESETAAITEEGTGEHIKEECDRSTKQRPESIEEIIPEDKYNKYEVSEQLTTDLSSTDNEKNEIDEHVTPNLSSLPVVEEVVNESCTKEIESKEKVEDSSLELKEKTDEIVFIEDTQEIIKDRVETIKNFDDLNAPNPLDTETMSMESNKDVLEKDKPTINDSESSSFPVVPTILECSKESEPKENNQVGGFDPASEERGLTTTEIEGVVSGNREINVKPEENFNLGVDREIEFQPNVNEDGEKVEYKILDTESGDQTEATEQLNVHDGLGIPASEDARENIENIEYNSLESIEQASMSSHDDGKAEESAKEEDNKDHIIGEDNRADQLEDSVAEFLEFQHQEKEAELSKKEIVEEYTTAQASKELLPDTNPDDESQERNYDAASLLQQDDREPGENKDPSIISVVPNVKEDLEKEKKEEKSDENNAHEHGISKEEIREPLPEQNEITDNSDFDLISKEGGTKIEKTKRGYKLEPEEASDGNDSKEIVDEGLENPKIVDLDEDSEKHITLDESNIYDTSPEFKVEETSNNYKEDLEEQHNIEASQMIQSVAKGTEDNEKQTIEEEPINRDNIKESETAAITEEETGVHIKEECDSSTKQRPKSTEEIIPEERYNEDKVSEKLAPDLSSTNNEKHEIDEHVTPICPSLPVVEEAVNESCIQSGTTEIESKEKVEDSSLELKEKTDETIFNEDTQEIIKDGVETTKNFDDLNAQNPLDAETVSIECNKNVLEKDRPTINDDESSSFPVVATVLECSKESEPIGNNQVGSFDLASQEKGLATTEIEGVESGNREINVEPKENFSLGVDREIEFQPDVNEAGEKVEHKMQDTESGDQTKEAEQLKVMTDNENTALDQSQPKGNEAHFITHTLRSTPLLTEAEPTCPKVDSETASIDIGIDSAYNENRENSHEVVSLPPEVSTVNDISGSEDLRISKEEGDSEINNQSDILKSDILNDDDLSNLGDKKSESEKPLDEASRYIEALDTVTYNEKPMEKGNPEENFEVDTKEIVEEEKTVVEPHAEILEQETGTPDTRETCILNEVNLESVHPGQRQRLESTYESEQVVEKPSYATLTETSDAQVDGNNSVQYQSTEIVDQKITESEVKEEEEEKIVEKARPELDIENQSMETKCANETLTDVNLTEQIPTVLEKVEEKEIITEQSFQGVTDTMEHNIVPRGDETVDEIPVVSGEVEEKIIEEIDTMEHARESSRDETVVEVPNSGSTLTNTLIPADSIEKTETTHLENEEPQREQEDAPPFTEVSEKVVVDRDGYIQVPEENNNGIIEQGEKCFDNLDTVSNMVVEDKESSKEPQLDQNPGEGFVTEEESSKEPQSDQTPGDSFDSVTDETNQQSHTSPGGEGVDSFKDKESLDSVTITPPPIECVDLDKKHVTVENPVDEIEQIQNASPAVAESKDQYVEDIDESERILPPEESHPEKEELQEHVTIKIIDKGLDEEPGELDFSKPIDGIDSQNESLKEEDPTPIEDSTLKSQGEKCFDNLDTVSNMVVEEEESSKEPQLDQNPGEGFVTEEESSKEPQSDQTPGDSFDIVTDETNQQSHTSPGGEGVDSFNDKESLDSVTITPPPIESVDLDKKHVTVENPVDEIEQIQNASPAVAESKDQYVEDIDESERNSPLEESHPAKEELQEHVTVKIIDKGQDEEPRELDFSKAIDGIDIKSESQKEEGPASIEDSTLKSQDYVDGMSIADPPSSKKNNELTSLADYSLESGSKDEILNLGVKNNNDDGLATTRIPNEEILTDIQCDKVPIDLEKSQTKESHLDAPIIKFGSEHTTTEVTNEEISKVAGDVEENEKIPELIIENKTSTGNATVDEVENSDVVLLQNLQPIDSISPLETAEEASNREGDASTFTSESNERAMDTQDDKTHLDPSIIVTQLSEENIKKGKIEQGDESYSNANAASVMGVAEEKTLEESQLDEKPGEYLNDTTEESTPHPTINTETCKEGEGIEETSDSTTQLPALDHEDVEKDNVFVEKQATTKIEDTANAYDELSEHKDQCVDEINESVRSLPVAEPNVKVSAEETKNEHETVNTIDNTKDEIINVEESFGPKIAEEACLYDEPQIPAHGRDNVDKENVEKQVTPKIEDSANATDAVSEYKDQRVNEIDESGRSLPVEEPNVEEFEKEIKHDHATVNIIESIKHENKSIEESSGPETTEEACLYNESQIPVHERDNVDEENVFVEKQVTPNIEDTPNASDAVSEHKDQCVKEIDESVRSLPVEERNAEEFEEKIKNDQSTFNIIESIKNENINIEESFGPKTTDEVHLYDEQPREIDVSKLVERGIKDSPNESLKEKSDTPIKDSKTVPEEDVSETINIDSPSKENSRIEASKNEEVLESESLNKEDDSPTTPQLLAEGIQELRGKSRDTSYLQSPETPIDSRETDIKTTHEAPVIEENIEENQKQKEADKESSNQLFESEETTKEIPQEDELMVEESPKEEKKETTGNIQYGNQIEEMPEEIQKPSIITHATKEENVPNETEGENFKETPTRSDLVTDLDIANPKDDIKKVTNDSEMKSDTTGTDQNEKFAINEKEEAPYTNPDLPQATSPSNEEAVAENKSEAIEVASDGIEVKKDMNLTGKEISIEATSFVDKYPQEEKPDDNRSIIEDAKTRDLVFDSHTGDETIAAERKTTDDEKEYTENKGPLDVLTRESDRTVDEAEIDNNIREIKDVEVQDKIEKPNEVIGVQDRDLPESKISSSVDISKTDETDQSIQKLETTRDQTSENQISKEVDSDEKERVIAATDDKDVQLAAEDTFEKTSQKTEVEGIKPETHGKVELEVAAVKDDAGEGKMPLSNLTEDSSEKPLHKTEVEGIKPETHGKDEPEMEAVKCEERKITNDAGEGKDSLPGQLQIGTRGTLPIAEHVSENKEPTLPKKEIQSEQTDKSHEEEAKADEEKHDGEEEDEHKKEDSGSDAPVMVEASKDIDAKAPHKKSHGILSGVGSKVKHSISKVKKAITGKSSHSKPLSPK